MVIDTNVLSKRKKFRMNDLMAKYKKLCPSDTVDHPQVFIFVRGRVVPSFFLI